MIPKGGIEMGNYDKKAYAQGVKDAQQAGPLEGVVHRFGDAIMSVLPSIFKDEFYEAGDHDTMSKKR